MRRSGDGETSEYDEWRECSLDELVLLVLALRRERVRGLYQVLQERWQNRRGNVHLLGVRRRGARDSGEWVARLLLVWVLLEREMLLLIQHPLSV